jgi:hypothetical protein
MGSSILEFELATKDQHGFCCCNTSQTEAFIVIGLTALITGVLWSSALFAPIKLVAVFLHEFSHATATWLTCGKVKRIEVYMGQRMKSEWTNNLFILSLYSRR